MTRPNLLVCPVSYTTQCLRSWYIYCADDRTVHKESSSSVAAASQSGKKRSFRAKQIWRRTKRNVEIDSVQEKEVPIPCRSESCLPLSGQRESLAGVVVAPLVIVLGASGVASRENCNSEGAFVCSLLHSENEIGRLVLFRNSIRKEIALYQVLIYTSPDNPIDDGGSDVFK